MSVGVRRTVGRCLTAAALVLFACKGGAQTPAQREAQNGWRLPFVQEVRPFPSAEMGPHATGDAVVSFHIGADGKTSDVKAQASDDELKQMAVSTVTYWKFPAGAAEDRRLTLHVRQVDAEFDDEVKELKHTVFNGPDEVTLTLTSHMTRRRSNCPERVETTQRFEQAAEDYVELERTRCFGSCPAYTVRVHRSGLVTWKSPMLAKKEDERRLPAGQAAELLAKFDTPVVRMACLNYDSHWTDNPTVFLRVSLGGKVKVIRDYGDAAPAAIRDLELAVDEVTDSHQWRVGDPRTEDPSAIAMDSWLPKRGKTALMRAAAHGREDEVKAELARGADVAATDSSGWTALMYAASSGAPKVIRALLDAHADPNQKGPRGETAVAFAGSWQKDGLAVLLGAGADPNVAMDDGTTLLMRVAATASAELIKIVLDSGARASARDREGRTAMDYLIAKSCGLEIRGGKISPNSWATKNGCDGLMPEPLAASRKLLEQAGAQQTRQWQPAEGVPTRVN